MTIEQEVAKKFNCVEGSRLCLDLATIEMHNPYRSEPVDLPDEPEVEYQLTARVNGGLVYTYVHSLPYQLRRALPDAIRSVNEEVKALEEGE